MRLYKKSQIWFAVVWIIAYCVLLSLGDNLSRMAGIEKSITLPVCIVLSMGLFCFLRKNGLLKEYGLCKSDIPAGKLLLYLPLAVLVSMNLWFGTAMNLSPLETALYICSMLLVGFLEEMIFRGLLFKAMCKDNVKSAIVVSSVTFGIGHIINLINGSGADLMSNLLQVGYAIAVGFLFVLLFYKTKSLLACIFTHSGVNALSFFADESGMTPELEIISAAILALVAIAYAVYIHFAVKNPRTEKSDET